MPTSPTRFDVDPAVDDAVSPGSRVLCIVPDQDDDDLLLALDAATQLARRQDATLVLYDRSQETWADTDHSDCIDIDQIDLGEAPHLATAISAAQDAGAAVQVWRSTIPTLGSGLLNAIQRGGADLVVVPVHGGEGRPVADNAVGGASGVAATLQQLLDKPLVTEAGADVPVATVSPDGNVRLSS